MSAPRTTISGALSPPIASREIARPALKSFHSLPGRIQRASSGGVRLALHKDFALVVMAARSADVMWALQLAAVGALHRRHDLQRMMGAPHVPSRLGDFLLGNRHGFARTKK